MTKIFLVVFFSPEAGFPYFRLFFRKRFFLSLSYTHNHRKKEYITINSPIPVNILSYLYRYYFTLEETKTYSSFQKSNKNICIKWPYFCIVYYIFSLISRRRNINFIYVFFLLELVIVTLLAHHIIIILIY